MSTLLVIFSALASFGVGWLLLCKYRLPLEKTVLTTGLVLSLISSLIMIPGSVPDEPAHIQTAYRYANVLLFKPYATENGGMLVRRDDVSLNRFSRYTTPGQSSYGEVMADWRWFCTGEGAELVEEEGLRDVRTGFAAYMVQGVGMALGRILHLGTWPMVHLSRVLNALAFSGMLWLAVRITPVKKTLFALLGCVPACVQAAGSVSYDAPIIGMTLVMTAYFLRLIHTQEHVGWKAWAISVLGAALLFPCKFMYASIFLLLFLVPQVRFGGMGRKAAFLASVAVLGVTSFIVSNISTIAGQLDTMGGQTGVNVLTNVEVYSFGWLLKNPLKVFQMVIQSLRVNADEYWQGMLGGRLIRFDNTIHWTLILLVCYVISAMRTPDETIDIPFAHKPVFLLAAMLTMLAGMVFMLVDYTEYGSQSIWGFQGRYMLPVLGLMLMGLSSSCIRVDSRMQRVLAAVIFACNGGAMADMVKWFMSNPF